MPSPICRRRFGGGAPFSPPQLSALQFRFSADMATSDTGLANLITTDGTAVAGLRDRGTLGNNATQATSGKRPLYKANIFNRQPGVLFTAASSQFLSADTAAAAFSGSNMPLTVIAVLQMVSISTQVFLGLGNSGGPAQWIFDAGAAGALWASSKHDDTIHSATVSGGTPDTSAHIVSWVGPGTTLTINLDGAVIANAVAQSESPTTLNTCTVGGENSNGTQSLFTNAYIAEIFCWSMALSPADQQTVRRAMGSKYGIATT